MCYLENADIFYTLEMIQLVMGGINCPSIIKLELKCIIHKTVNQVKLPNMQLFKF